MLTHPIKIARVRSVFLVFAALTLAACAGGESDELSLPDETQQQTDTEETAAPEAEIDPEPTTSTTSEPTTTTTSSAFTPATVSFDPDNPPPLDEVERLAFEAVEAAYGNRLWCMDNLDICDPEIHLAPALASSFQFISIEEIRSFQADGGDYRGGDQDNIYLIESVATLDGEFTFGDDNSLRIIGEVDTCEIYNGEFYTNDELTADEPIGYETTRVVWQADNGTLLVADESFSDENQGGIDYCDAYME
ncbi:MAG: hypothetical protein AAF467_17655 [Actinomycetota bacterium]